MNLSLPSLLAAALALASCDSGHGHAPQPAESGRSHTHAAPHAALGGVLVELGEHHAQFELLPDAQSGELRLYFLDGHASNPVRLAQPTVEIDVVVSDESFVLALYAMDSGLTGETVGDSSEFFGKDERLVGTKEFSGALRRAEVAGATFTDVPFRYPAGNAE